MKDPFEYGEDEIEEDVFDEDDEVRMAILQAEADEVWLEEPGDEDGETELPLNPLFGMLSAAGRAGFPGFPVNDQKDNEKYEDPEH